MAITIEKEPTALYPAYNDSFLVFGSDLTNNDRAEISALPALDFPKPFVVYPDSDGKYTFNLKEIAKVGVNKLGFEDSEAFDDAFFKSIGGNYLSQDITIEVFNSTTSETLNKTYTFLKSAYQVGDRLNDNPYQLMTYNQNSIDHYLTYWEGFPFHFTIQRATNLDDINIKNIGTGLETGAMTASETSSFRLNVDNNEGDDWTNQNFLPLTDLVNKLEIYANDVFKSNLFLKKRSNCSGVYLKWLNRQGDYNFWLFDEFYQEQQGASDLDFVGRNEFNNIQDLGSQFRSIGKESQKTLTVKTKFDAREAEVLSGLIDSPSVQMYSSKEYGVKGEFIDVDIDANFSFFNKRNLNNMTVTINLPELITIRY